MAAFEIPIIEKGKDKDDAQTCFACMEGKLNLDAVKLCKDCEQFYCKSCMNKHDEIVQSHDKSYEIETVKRGMVGSTPEANLSEDIEPCQLYTEFRSTSEASVDVPEQDGASGENIQLGKCDLHPSQDLNAFCEDDEMLCCNICTLDHR